MYFKKALSNSIIVTLLVGIIFLIVGLASILSYFEDYDYQSDVLSCSQFFKSVSGEEIYFDKLNKPTAKFENTFAQICSAKTIKLEESNIEELADLADDCWDKLGKGREFIGPYMLETKLCFYCGKAVVNDEISDFNEKFVEIISQDTYDFNESYSSVNLNEVNLKKPSLPQNLNQGEELSVIYSVYKDPNFEHNIYTKFKTFVEGEISDLEGWIGLVTEFFADSSGVDLYSGVMLTKDLDKLNELGCRTLIPIKEYE